MQGSGGALAAAAAEERETSTPPTSRHYSREYAKLVQSFAGASIDVSFRELVGPLPANEYTHGLFPYPARLLRHIPRFLLATDAVVDGIDLVFDPFVGSGTVLLEAQLRGLDSLGVEQNPVAALVSRLKVTQGPITEVPAILAATLDEAKRTRRSLVPSSTLARWYSTSAMSALGRLTACVVAAPAAHRDVLSLCLALTARRVACTDPRIPVPVRTERNAKASTSDVWCAWTAEADSIARKLGSLPGRRADATVVHGDARDIDVWPDAARSRSTLLLSSPPYGAAQKYVRSTSLEAGWLGFAPQGRTAPIEHNSVGREHLSTKDHTLTRAGIWSAHLRRTLATISEKDARRGQIYLAYFMDMQQVFINAQTRGVRRIALVMGTNNVVGGALHTSQHLAEMVESVGYRRTISLRDPIRGRTLLTSRRNGTPSPAEYIDVFEVADA